MTGRIVIEANSPVPIARPPDGKRQFGETGAIGRDHAPERVVGDIDNGH